MTAYDALPDLLLREEWRALPVAPPAEPLLSATVAIGAGEASRALAALDAAAPPDADAEAVVVALRLAAGTLRDFWFPGGTAAAIEPDAMPAIVQPNLQATAPDAATVVTLARKVVADGPTLRSIATSAADTGLPQVVEQLDEVAQLLTAVEVDRPRAVGPLALFLLDLHARFGTPAPDGLLDRARAAYAGDPVGTADCALAELDAAVFRGRADTLGEDLERSGADQPTFADGTAAAYAAVAEQYRAAGADRGVAVVALRLAQIAQAAEDEQAAQEQLDRAAELAAAAEDTALTQLVAVHAELFRAERGDLVAADALGAQVATWASTVGSRTFARGLARLAVRRAERLRADVAAADQALGIARSIADALAAVPEQAMATAEAEEQMRASGLRRARVVETLAALDEAQAGAGEVPATGGDLEWVRLVTQAVNLEADANPLADPALLARIVTTSVWLQGRRPPAPEFPEAMAMLAAEIVDMATDANIGLRLYIGDRQRQIGDDTADNTYRSALAIAEDSGVALKAARALGAARRFTEAADVLDTIRDTVAPAEAALYYARLARRFDIAAELLAVAPDGGTWNEATWRADAALGTGDTAAAVAWSAKAITRFEQLLRGVPSDLERTGRLDEPSVAGLYTTAVRGNAAAGRLDAAFRLSDSARGMALTDVVDAENDTTTDAERAAVRAWQRAGAELGRTIEETGAVARSPAAMRARLTEASRGLRSAEARMRRAAPAAWERRRTVPTGLDLAHVQERLAPDTLVLQYHAFDDALVTFAVTHDSARVTSTDVVTSALSGMVHRFHAAVRDRFTTASAWEGLGTRLAALLLDPFRDELAAHEQVVIVPWGNMGMLPFGVLPHADADLATGHVVSSVPSLSAVLGREAPPVADGPALVVGGLEYAIDARLEELPATAVEARRIADLYGVEPLVGRAADPATVLRGLSDARVAHLATHGELREGAPYSSWLALSGSDRLSVPDLVGLDLRCALIVLSACQSGRGVATANGDTIGLSRALLGSGARSIVVSLWPVDDAYTCLLMALLHEELRDHPPARALAAAAAALRTLTPDDALARYVALGGAPEQMQPGNGVFRGVEPEESARDDSEAAGAWHPALWAPFVHIGMP